MALSETIEPEKVSRGKRGTRPPLGKTFGLRESRYCTVRVSMALVFFVVYLRFLWKNAVIYEVKHEMKTHLPRPAFFTVAHLDYLKFANLLGESLVH